MKYTVKPTAQFKKDYRRAMRHGADMGALDAIIAALGNGEALPPNCRDRALSGPWAGHRECRVSRDRMLIYRIDGECLVLTLTRTGTPAALYEKGGVNAMKRSTSLRMLLRSPVKTAVTLLLIAAASFLFLYNLLDYAMTKREYDRTYRQYHGYFTLLHPEDAEVRTDGGEFFLSDPESNPAWNGNPLYETAHLKSFTEEELESIAALPYVSKVEKRYMTGGLSTYPRIINNSGKMGYYYLMTTTRVILEATYAGAEQRTGVDTEVPASQGLAVGMSLTLQDVKVLAGDAELLEQSRAYLNRKELSVSVTAMYPEKADGSPQSKYFFSIVGAYAKNYITTEDVESLEKGQRYVFVAAVDAFYMNASGIIPEDKYACYTYMGDDSLYGLCDYFTPLAGEPENYWETEKFAGHRQLAEIMERDSTTLDVYYMEDMRSLRYYQEGELQPIQGRMLTREDTENRNPVCVVPEVFAQTYGLKLGDTLHLELGDRLMEQCAYFGAVQYSALRASDTWTGQNFTIVGTYTEGQLENHIRNRLFWDYGENAIMVPRSFLPETADTESHSFKPTELSFVIEDADSIIPFRDEVLPQLQAMGYTVYFYDGNWPAVSEQLHQAGSLGQVKLLAFGLSAALVLLLTVYLYILRKRTEFAVMRALGCPSREAQKALLFPLLALAVPAVLLGSAAAAVYAHRAAEVNAAEFAWLGTVQDTSLPLGAVLLGFGGSLLLLLLLALAALRSVAGKPPLELLQGESHHRQKSLPPELTESVELAPLPVLEPLRYRPRTAVRHTLGYVWRRIRRTPAKTLLSLLLALALCFSIGFVTLLRDTYRDLYRNIEIHPRFLGGFSNNRAKDVEKSGYVRDPFYVYRDSNCESSFVDDTLILTNDLSRVTEAEVTWREDKGPDIFTKTGGFCVISRDLADELGLDLGSKLEICRADYLYILAMSYPSLTKEEIIDQVYHEAVNKLTVAGIAEEEGKFVYAAVEAWPHFGTMFTDYVPLDLAEYTLIDYHRATEFRSWVFRLLTGRQGSFSMETAEADRVYQTYRLLELLYPIAFALALILGGVLPAGVILQSAREASLLRVLGTSKRRTRAMLSLEQLFLCFIGLCLAVGALVIAKGSALLAVAGLVAVYAAAHLLACAVSTEAAAVSVTRRNVLELLQVKE